MTSDVGNAWEMALIDLSNSLRGQPFNWGETDCAMLVLRAIDTLRPGKRHFARHHGKYKSRAQALKFARTRYTLRDYIAGLECARRVSRNFQQRGDLLVAGDELLSDAYVCMGSVALTSGPELGVNLCRIAGVLERPGLEIWRVR